MNNYHSYNKSVCAFVTILFMLFANPAIGQSLGECATSFDTTVMYQPLRSFDYSSDTWLYNIVRLSIGFPKAQLQLKQ